MTDKPDIGTEIEMPFMSGDTLIVVDEVPVIQPLAETDDSYVIVDQYGEEHLVELDGEVWVVVTPEALSVEGQSRWQDYQDERRSGRNPGR